MILQKTTTTSYYFLFFSLCFIQTKAQSHEPHFRELIVELPALSSEKSLSNTVFGLVSMGGIRYEGYCEQMKCLMLTIDENTYTNDLLIMNKIKEFNTSFNIKPTGKIYLVKEACKDPTLLNTEQTANILDK